MKHNSFTLVILTAAVLVGGCAKQPDAPRSVANAEQPKPQPPRGTLCPCATGRLHQRIANAAQQSDDEMT